MESDTRTNLLEQLLAEARDVMRCEVTHHHCNTDTHVVGAPPCCDSCRVHLRILKTLRDESGETIGGLSMEDAEKAFAALAKAGFRLLSVEDDSYRQAAEWAHKYVENTTECTILPKSRNMAMWFLRLEAENQALRERLTEVEDGDQ